MYGYNQGGYGGYGSSYTANAIAAASAAYGGLGQAAANPQQNLPSSVFGSSNSYANYGNTVAAAAYGYNQHSSNAASNTAQAFAAQAVQQQATKMFDAYTAAANLNPNQYAPFGAAGKGYGSGHNASTGLGGYVRSSATGNPIVKSSLTSALSSVTPKNNTNNYSGYDAAVYAAASNFLQSQASGGAPMWMHKKANRNNRAGSGAGPGFPQKRFGNGSQGRETQQYYCEICKISCAGQLTYKEHLDGQRHKKKEALAKGENSQSLPKSKVSFRCDLCNVTCTGQDTYNAHVRGTKHQKTLALCKKLGKPIPTQELTIIAPSEMGGTIPPPPNTTATGSTTTTTTTTENKKGAAPTNKEAIVSAVKAQPEELQALIAAEQNVRPVGEEFIEAQRDSTGKLVQYLCSLCDCRFSDPNAKEIHLKGRRHRLQYKIKVDPNIEVEVKAQPNRGRGNRFNNTPVGRAAQFGRGSWYGAGPRGPWFNGGPFDRRFESPDDRHVQAKEQDICPTDDLRKEIEDLVVSVEKSLKTVSDFINARSDGDETSTVKEGEKEKDKLLMGFMRMGLISKDLLLKCDEEVELAVLCSTIPTQNLLTEVTQLVHKHYESEEGCFSVEEDIEKSSFIVTKTNLNVKCRVVLTSRAFREGVLAEWSPDSLNKDICLQALANLRRTNWFQARCASLHSCASSIRILRDIRMRNSELSGLTDWICELLVENILSCALVPLSNGDALRRVFEAIASGILLPCGPGLLDPCEKEKVDALSNLSLTERDSITAYAQQALRFVAFNQIYKVLGIERLPDVRPPLMDRKRPLDNDKKEEEIKKDKKGGEDVIVKMEVN